MSEQIQPTSPREHLDAAATRLALADALAVIHPPSAREVVDDAAEALLRSAGSMLIEKLRSLGLTDEEIEQSTIEDLLRLAPNEMAEIAEVRNRVLDSAVTNIGASAISNQLYLTDRLMGHAKNN
ncbi:MAG TPA: hypothetical protein VFZ58_01345 [Candidatus Saccharimonadales bacterium]